MERRLFLRSLALTGGVTAGAGLISACSTSTAANNEDDFEQDVDLVVAGAEFEAMGIKTYEVAAGSGLLTNQAVIDTAVAFMNDHIGHLSELNDLLTSFGHDAINPANADPDPGVSSVANQTDVIQLAHSVEFQAATFYFSGIVNEIKSSAARRVFANILPVETAHFVTFKNVLGFDPAINGYIFEDLTSGLEVS